MAIETVIVTSFINDSCKCEIDYDTILLSISKIRVRCTCSKALHTIKVTNGIIEDALIGAKNTAVESNTIGTFIFSTLDSNLSLGNIRIICSYN